MRGGPSNSPETRVAAQERRCRSQKILAAIDVLEVIVAQPCRRAVIDDFAASHADDAVA